MSACEHSHTNTDDLESLQRNKKIKNEIKHLEKHRAYEDTLLSQKFPPSSTKLRIIQEQPQQNYETKIKRGHTFTLDCFLKTPNKVVKPKKDVKEIYTGNLLDSDNPIRSSGKYRETPKKKIQSKLKEDVLKHESQGLSNDGKIIYQDNIVTDELNEVTTKFLKKIVTFQENAFKKDQEKAKIKRRYVLGLHETKKYFLAKKIVFLIIATDMRIYSSDEILYTDIINLTRLAKDSEIPYVFTLKRSKIGNLTKTYRPISCVGVLNYQSAEAELQDILNNLTRYIDEESESDENVYEELLEKLKDASITECQEKM